MGWAAFSDAVDGMNWLARDALTWKRNGRAVSLHCAMCAQVLVQSIKFYLPDVTEVLMGRRYEDIEDLLDLPYDSISLLSEKVYPEGRTEILSIAFKSDGPMADKVISAEYSVPAFAGEEPWFYLASLQRSPLIEAEKWTPGLSLMLICKSPNGVKAHRLVSPWGISSVEHLEEMRPVIEDHQLFEEQNVQRMMTLLVMLSLKNVRPKQIAPPPKLNAKRSKNGRLPLWSYHVLSVDGQVWDAPEHGQRRAPESEQAYRSHLRRGHIRRIDCGSRHVWVRATYVHGKVDGFVAKGYTVERALSSD